MSYGLFICSGGDNRNVPLLHYGIIVDNTQIQIKVSKHSESTIIDFVLSFFATLWMMYKGGQKNTKTAIPTTVLASSGISIASKLLVCE
jgi:hypothetical protein